LVARPAIGGKVVGSLQTLLRNFFKNPNIESDMKKAFFYFAIIFVLVQVSISYAGNLIPWNPFSKSIIQAFEGSITKGFIMKGLTKTNIVAPYINAMLPKSLLEWRQTPNSFGTFWEDKERIYSAEFWRFRDWAKDWSDIIHNIIHASHVKDIADLIFDQ